MCKAWKSCVVRVIKQPMGEWAQRVIRVAGKMNGMLQVRKDIMRRNGEKNERIRIEIWV